MWTHAKYMRGMQPMNQYGVLAVLGSGVSVQFSLPDEHRHQPDARPERRRLGVRTVSRSMARSEEKRVRRPRPILLFGIVLLSVFSLHSTAWAGDVYRFDVERVGDQIPGELLSDEELARYYGRGFPINLARTSFSAVRAEIPSASTSESFAELLSTHRNRIRAIRQRSAETEIRAPLEKRGVSARAPVRFKAPRSVRDPSVDARVANRPRRPAPLGLKSVIRSRAVRVIPSGSAPNP